MGMFIIPPKDLVGSRWDTSCTMLGAVGSTQQEADINCGTDCYEFACALKKLEKVAHHCACWQ